MPEKFTDVGVVEGALVTHLMDLTHIVQQCPDDQQVFVDAAIERYDGLDQPDQCQECSSSPPR